MNLSDVIFGAMDAELSREEAISAMHSYLDTLALRQAQIELATFYMMSGEYILNRYFRSEVRS